MADSFFETGDFFATSGVPRVDTLKLERRIWSLVNTAFWAVVILVPMLYYLVKLFLSGSVYFFAIGVGIIVLCEYLFINNVFFFKSVYYIKFTLLFPVFLLMKKTIGMSEINKGSSYGANDGKKVK